jgi:hypothetical protein
MFYDNPLPTEKGGVEFFPDGVGPDTKHSQNEYNMFGPHYDDGLMRDAVKNLTNNPGTYCPFLNDAGTLPTNSVKSMRGSSVNRRRTHVHDPKAHRARAVLCAAGERV